MTRDELQILIGALSTAPIQGLTLQTANTAMVQLDKFQALRVKLLAMLEKAK